MASNQQTTAEQRAAFRERYGGPPEWIRHEDAPTILALLDDADALEVVMAERNRLRRVLEAIREDAERIKAQPPELPADQDGSLECILWHCSAEGIANA